MAGRNSRQPGCGSDSQVNILFIGLEQMLTAKSRTSFPPGHCDIVSLEHSVTEALCDIQAGGVKGENRLKKKVAWGDKITN